MSKPPDDKAIAAVVATLTPEEQAALPSRLRALVADETVVAWNAAKAERDAAIAAATTVDEETGVTFTDLDQVAAAKEAWAARKAELQGEG